MNSIREWLFERKVIYSILALIYRGEAEASLSLLKESSLLKEVSKYAANSLLSTASSEVLRDINEKYNSNQYIGLILEDYDRLFVGPNEILAPLWESVYREKDKLIFGDIELEVRRFYNNVGLDSKENEPADYLPLQLSFMSRLCNMALEGEIENVNKNLIKQQEFLNNHLLSWVPVWSEDVSLKGETNFWRNISLLTEEWLKNDLAEVKSILKM